MKYKPGDKIIRTSGFYNKGIKDWTAVILNQLGEDTYTVKTFDGTKISWRDVYFRKYTKLHKALK